MQNFHRQALQGVENLWKVYLLSRNPEEPEQVPPPFSRDVVLLGIGLENQVVGLDAVKERFLRDEQNAQDLDTELLKECYAVQSITPDVCVIYGTFFLHHARKTAEEPLQICLSVVCSNTADGVKMHHLHRSLPNTAASSAPARAEGLASQHAHDNHEQYRLAIEASDDILIEMNLAHKIISVDAEKMHRIYHICLTDLPPEKIFSALRSLIHPEDVTQFTSVFGSGIFPVWREDGELPKAIVFRLRNPQKGDVWVCDSLIPIRNHSGKVIKVLNHIKNIDLQKKKELQILGIAQTDSLTSVFNRGSTESAINDFLAARKDAAGVMMMIDIDNFKKINDTYGHLRGDEVLREVSRILRSVCRAQDIVGRVGGDEFLVFIKQLQSQKLISAKAQEILDKLDAFLLEEGILCDASCSIGISTAPLDGTTYSMLFFKADAALYHVKRHSKHAFCGGGLATER